MNRRKFIRHIGYGAAATAFVSLPSMVLADPYERYKKGLKKITILHTNDMHSHIDPFPDNDPKYPGLGGMARRAALVKKIRAEESSVVLLDAGDIFQGTPYFNFFGGELELKLMSEMGYAASAIGNHDFDNGLEGLLNQMPNASFPFLNANYDFSDTILKGHIKEYLILKEQGIKIGLFGLGVELDGLVDKKLYGNTLYQDPIKKAKEISSFLKKDMNCDLVICLSHLGYDYKTEKVSDLKLAAQTVNIDLIIGGHTHTFLTEPQQVINQEGKPVLINQVGWAGVNLGRIDFIYESGEKSYITESSMNEISEKTISI